MLSIDFAEYSIERGNEGRVFAVNASTGSLYTVGELSYDRQRVRMILYSSCDNCSSVLFVLSVLLILVGHIKNIHLHSCKHKTVTLKLTLTLTLTLTDTGGAVLTLCYDTED